MIDREEGSPNLMPQSRALLISLKGAAADITIIAENLGLIYEFFKSTILGSFEYINF